MMRCEEMIQEVIRKYQMGLITQQELDDAINVIREEVKP